MYTAFEALPLDKMLARVQKYYPGDGYLMVEKAYHFAEKAHADQKRNSGEPYIIHPAFVASVLTELMLDAPTVAAGLLHDTLEDVDWVTMDVLREEFSEEVAQLVDGVTKLNKLDFADREEAQAESVRKMILAMSRDIRVVLIKLADRLHNMRTLKYKPDPERQRAIAQETLDIYAPLAHRLGVYAIKQELEDLSLRYIDPEGYQRLVGLVGMRRQEREENIRIVIGELSERLDQEGLHYDIDGRSKHFYSIYRKMVLQHKSFDQIYDLIAIRVLVDTEADCYHVLGIVHALWNQVPGRFKDYISNPKANMYRSLHTTVVGGRKMPFPFEVQIRTWEMHRVAEYGIAAHWRYKEGGKDSDLDRRLYWVRQILDWSKDTRDSQEFIDTLRTDLFTDEVFLFTPKGDVKSMPKGATPLDFAYAIHSGVGNRCVGAKINGRIVPLDTELATGDRVEIMTSPSAKGPSIDWLRICHTAQAKNKIRQFLKKERREENLELGRSMVEHECKRRGCAFSDVYKPEYCESIMRKYGLQGPDDILAAVGYGGMTAAYVVGKLMDEFRAHEPPAVPPPPDESRDVPRKPINGIILQGNTNINVAVNFARCCNPVPGDEIIGYITRGRGVSIHKANCANIRHAEPERRVPVSWAENGPTGTFCVAIKILANDRVGLMADITSFLAGMGVSIRNISTSVNARRDANIRLVLEVRSREQVDTVLRQLSRQPDVMDVFRVSGG